MKRFVIVAGLCLGGLAFWLFRVAMKDAITKGDVIFMLGISVVGLICCILGLMSSHD